MKVGDILYCKESFRNTGGRKLKKGMRYRLINIHYTGYLIESLDGSRNYVVTGINFDMYFDNKMSRARRISTEFLRK